MKKISALLSRSKTPQKQLKQAELKMFASDSQKELKIWKNTTAFNIFTEGENIAFCMTCISLPSLLSTEKSKDHYTCRSFLFVWIPCSLVISCKSWANLFLQGIFPSLFFFLKAPRMTSQHDRNSVNPLRLHTAVSECLQSYYAIIATRWLIHSFTL